MVWIIIGITWILIFIVSYFGDYEEKEKKREYEEYKEVIYAINKHKKW